MCALGSSNKNVHSSLLIENGRIIFSWAILRSNHLDMGSNLAYASVTLHFKANCFQSKLRRENLSVHLCCKISATNYFLLACVSKMRDCDAICARVSPVPISRLEGAAVPVFSFAPHNFGDRCPEVKRVG